MTAESDIGPNGRSRRGLDVPFGVIVVSLVIAFNAIYTVLSLGSGATESLLTSAEEIRRFLPQAAPRDFLRLAFGTVGLIPALGLWSLRRWVWVLAMIWVGGDLAIALYRYIDGWPDYLSMALSVVAVFYLNQRDVQLAFRANVESPPGD